MTWRLQGTYFENCNCDMVCPCTTSGMSAPADNDRCHVTLVFHVDSGEVDGLDVSGLSVALLADTPALMSEGGWRVGGFIDAGASAEQNAALGAVFSGQMGGMPAALAGLMGEMLGMESAPIEYVDDGLRHSVRIGDAVEIEVQDFVSAFSATGGPVTVTGVGFPNDTLTAGKATTARVDAFGLQWSNEGKNSFSSPFSWTS
jgi:hypothetical protein